MAPEINVFEGSKVEAFDISTRLDRAEKKLTERSNGMDKAVFERVAQALGGLMEEVA